MFRRNKIGVLLLIMLVAAVVTIIGLLMWRINELQDRSERAEAAIEQLVTQNRGVEGPQGDRGPGPTDEQIAEAVEAYCALHNGCAGPAGVAGKDGTNGTNGRNGTDGKSLAGTQGAAGLGVTRVQCNGTSVSFFSGNQLVGNIAMVCIQ